MIYDTEPMIHGGIVLSGEEFRLFSDGSFNGKIEINKDLLKTFNPCADRWKNFLEYYSEFNGSFDDFVDLDNCSYDDKIWVAKKVLSKNQLVHFGLLCAESVLSIFEDKYLNDTRVGDCLRYLMSIKDFNNITAQEKEKILEHRYAAYAAAYAAVDAAADAAAYAAADAADAAAYAAAAAADAAAYAAADAAADAADAAADAAAYAAARKMQQGLNLELLKVAASL